MESCFNPRARDGREFHFLDNFKRSYVSIHAPVMDAKRFGLQRKTITWFQSTRP